MYTNLTNEEILIKIQEHKEEANRIEKLLSVERKAITELSKELNSRHNWSKNTVFEHMINQLEESKTQISEISYRYLKKEIMIAKDPSLLRGTTRRYGYGDIVESIYFDLGPLIESKIKRIRTDHRFKSYSRKYTVKFIFNSSDVSIRRTVGGNVFEEPEHHNRYVTLKPLGKENMTLMKKSINKHFPQQINKYEEIIPIMIEITKFIDSDFEGIVLGCHLSQQ